MWLRFDLAWCDAMFYVWALEYAFWNMRVLATIAVMYNLLRTLAAA